MAAVAAGRLPDFLGVGQPRTASSWLDSVLRGHVGLPAGIKEVDFFVKNYSRGIDWYAKYFADCDPSLPIGEICPSYLGSDDARGRIAHHLPDCKIICTFRDPVEMLFSFWKLARRNAWTACDFADYRPTGWQRGQGIRGWFDSFGRKNVLTLIYDDLALNPQRYLDEVCDFLAIQRIPIAHSPVATRKVNSFERMPRSQALARRGRKLRDYLQSRERFTAINLLTRIGFWRLCFDGGAPFPPLDPAVEAHVRARLMSQIEELERAIERDLSAWKIPRDDDRRELKARA